MKMIKKTGGGWQIKKKLNHSDRFDVTFNSWGMLVQFIGLISYLLEAVELWFEFKLNYVFL